MAAKNFSAFSAILSPINPGKIQVWRIAKDTHVLGFDQRDIGGSAGSYVTRTNKDTTNVPSTVLLTPSSLVALQFNDLINVYGVAAETNVVSLISPFVEPVVPQMKSSTGFIAGCTNGESAWIYYQDGTSIGWSDVSDPDSNNDILPATEVKANTRLGAIWDTERAWVVYQTNGGQLVAYNTDKQTPSSVNFQSKFFIEQTPIGCSFVVASDIDTSKVTDFNQQALGRMFVYWLNDINGKKTLYRAHSDLMSGATTAAFSPDCVQVGSQPTYLEPDAQISVVVDKNDQSNRIFVAKAGDKDKVTVVTDKFFNGKKK